MKSTAIATSSTEVAIPSELRGLYGMMPIQQPIAERTYNTLNSSPMEFPWAGSHFGVPESAKAPEPESESYTLCEAEMQLLLKTEDGFKEERFTMQGRNPNRLEFFDNEIIDDCSLEWQTLMIPLEEIAFRCKKAVAFTIYYTKTDSRTNIKKVVSPYLLRMMKNQFGEWLLVGDQHKRFLHEPSKQIKIRDSYIYGFD